MPDPEDKDAELGLLLEFLRRTHLSTATDLPEIVAEEVARIGARDAELLLIDHEQGTLVSLGPYRHDAEDLAVVGSVAGRSFSSTTMLQVPHGDGTRVWLPLLDGTERLGVLGLSFDAPLSETALTVCERFAHLVATVAVSKSAYSDVFEMARRRTGMTIATELVQAMAPPLVFATNGLTVAGMLEPAYDNGGDTLDYAINERRLHAGVFDAMGHGLPAAGVAAFALAAYRHSRRADHDLETTYAVMDDAVGTQFPEHRFVTAVIAQLDLDDGQLRWISAGHPPPLLLRNGRHPRLLDVPPAPPLGVEPGSSPVTVATESLEPGDLVIFYTDGLTEARGEDGRMLGTEGLGEFIEREAAAGETAPETLRRLRQSIVERAELRDDATALLLQWGVTPDSLMPQRT